MDALLFPKRTRKHAAGCHFWPPEPTMRNMAISSDSIRVLFVCRTDRHNEPYIQRGENWTGPHTNYPHQNLVRASQNIPAKYYHCSIYILLPSTNRDIKQDRPDMVACEIRAAGEPRASPWHRGWLKHPVYNDVANEISSPCLRKRVNVCEPVSIIISVCECVWKERSRKKQWRGKLSINLKSLKWHELLWYMTAPKLHFSFECWLNYINWPQSLNNAIQHRTFRI